MNTGLIMFSTLVMVASGEAKSLSNNKGFVMEPVIAAFVLGIFLFIFDEIAPRVTKLLVILILVGLFVPYKDPQTGKATKPIGTYLLNIIPTSKKG